MTNKQRIRKVIKPALRTQIAKRLHLTYAYLRELERDPRRHVPLDVLDAYSQAGVPWDALLPDPTPKGSHTKTKRAPVRAGTKAQKATT